MTDKKPMAAVLAQIMGEVGRIEKKGKITSQGSGPSYKFARDSDVLEAVTPKMAEAGIILVPEHQELLSMDMSISGKQFIANIKTAWIVTDGSESIRFETFGQGADVGDKALPKAQSNARKYAFFMLYHIVTGDDPDYHASDYEQPGQGASPSRGSRRASSEASRPAPAPADTLREELAQVAADKHIGIDGITEYVRLLFPDAPPGQKLDDEQMRQLIEAVKGHGTDAPLDIAQAAGTPSVAAEPEAGDDAPPAPAAKPRNRTVEEAIADAEAKAKAGAAA